MDEGPLSLARDARLENADISGIGFQPCRRGCSSEPGLRTGVVVPGFVIGRNGTALQHLHKGFAAALDGAAVRQPG